MTASLQQFKSFEEFSLPPSLLKALKLAQYKTPTFVQSKTIPSALLNRDVLVHAQNDFERTLTFCVPVLAKLEKSPQKSALILAPSNELASRIENTLKTITKTLPKMSIALLLNGAAMGAQQKLLEQKPRVIVSTPARLIEHLKRGNLSLFRTEILVLDELDRMLAADLGLQITEILRFLPKARQTLSFSSKLSPEMQRFVTKSLKDPVRIAMETALLANTKIN